MFILSHDVSLQVPVVEDHSLELRETWVTFHKLLQFLIPILLPDHVVVAEPLQGCCDLLKKTSKCIHTYVIVLLVELNY